MKSKLSLFVLLVMLFIGQANAQNTFPSTGSVGIGTATPNVSSLLEINSTTKGLLIPRMTATQRNAIATPATGLMIYQTNNTPGFYYYDGSSWNPVVLKTSANKTLSNLTAPSAINADLLPDYDNNRNIGSSTLRYGNLYTFNLKFADATTQTTAFIPYTAGTGITITGNSISSTTAASQWTTSSSNIYYNTGNVGIGIAAPALAGLVVNTKVGSVNAMFGSNTTGVAIETANPGIGLNTYYNGGRKFIAAGYGAVIGLDPSSGLLGFYNSASSGTASGAATLPVDLAIAASGNVGIGTTTPTTGGLVVNTKVGAINAMFGSNTTGVAIESNYPGIGLNTYYNSGRKFIAAGYGAVISLDPTSGLLGFYNSTSSGAAGGATTVTTDLVITAAGNVGVGTATPAAKLDVNGDALINGLTVGRGSKNIVTNIAFGLQPLFSDSTGYDNIAIGQSALYSNTTGSGNLACGASALNYNTTGNNNIAIGASSLYNNITGTDNIAIGVFSFQDNLGTGNTGLGFFTNINGDNLSNSTALGQSALITASNQVRIGSNTVNSIGGYVDWSNISDGRVKKNIKENVPGLAFINKLSPITYNLDLDAAEKIIHRPILKDKEGNAIKPSQFELNSIKVKEQIVYTGFIAQDVEKAAKSLNYDFSGVDAAKNSKDLYGLRYAEFVVPLVKGEQELDDSLRHINQTLTAEVDVLQEQMNEMKTLIQLLAAKSNIALPSSSVTLSSASLEQNIPNPFHGATTIGYTLPQTYSSAQIIIRDNSGKTLKAIPVSGTGKGSLNVDASTISGGAYNYSLLIDGKLIDTKQMVLAK